MGVGLTLRLAACAAALGRFLATVGLGNLPALVPFFGRILAALRYRIRGAANAPGQRVGERYDATSREYLLGPRASASSLHQARDPASTYAVVRSLYRPSPTHHRKSKGSNSASSCRNTGMMWGPANWRKTCRMLPACNRSAKALAPPKKMSSDPPPTQISL